MMVETLNAATSARLVVIGVGATVQAAARWLSRPGIGLVAVCDAGGGLRGVVSKSDLVRHMAGPSAPVSPVSELMSRSIVSCRPRDELHAAWQTMSARGLQNMPVIDGAARPVGILDIRDAMKALFEQEQMLEQALSNYVAGIGYR